VKSRSFAFIAPLSLCSKEITTQMRSYSALGLSGVFGPFLIRLDSDVNFMIGGRGARTSFVIVVGYDGIWWRRHVLHIKMS